MASVGLGMAVTAQSGALAASTFFGTAARAQVNQAVSNAAQPAGFADMVERVKPSVISVKVTMKKATDVSETAMTKDPVRRWSASSTSSVAPMGRRKNPVPMAGAGK